MAFVLFTTCSLLIEQIPCPNVGEYFNNTNASKKERQKYITKAKAYKFKVTGYFFNSSIADALMRNRHRTGKENIPFAGIIATHKKLEIPEYAEGFDKLYEVAIINGGFV